jgi:lysyl-tRNA synthetase class 2
MNDRTRWRAPGPDGKTRLELLQARHAIRRAVRAYLDGEGFIEIDAPLLVRGTTPDAAIQSFTVGGRCLVTSTEYQLRRLEAGGLSKLYTLTQNFRAGETGRYRNPEFTMLEWARAGAPYEVVEADAEQIVIAGAQAVGGDGRTLHYQDHTIDLTPPFPRLSVREAIIKATGARLDDFSVASLGAAARAAGIAVRGALPPDEIEDADFLFSLLMEKTQPHLGFDRPVFLTDWPSFQTSSAAPGAGDDTTARSELIIAGVELSNGFPSLNGAAAQREAFAAQQARRRVLGLPEVPLDDAYLAMMEDGMPNDSSIALGFDRLAMLLTGQTGIAPVLAFGWEEL